MESDESKLRTVSAPPIFKAAFARAEQLVSSYFSRRKDDPEKGTIEIQDERYVLVRAASLSVEFFDLVRDLYGLTRQADADDFSRNLLFDLAHAIGRSDARRFHARMNLTDPVERLTAGPVHFAHTGWAYVDIFPESRPVPDESYYLIYDHPYSFEASAWLAADKKATFPVCIMNAGYSSGWCQESFGLRLVASELLCRAQGDEACRFVMAPPEKIELYIDNYFDDKPLADGQVRTHQIPDFFVRKKIEEELHRAQSELEQRVVERTTELRLANERLQKEMIAREHVEEQLLQAAKLEAVGRLAGGIAHDFNNLMGVVIGHASHMERRVPPTDPFTQNLVEIRKAGQEAALLSQQLLAFSRSHVPQVELVDLNQLVDETMLMFKSVIGENVQLKIELAFETGSVRADRAQLRQVIINLVVNARDAMPGGGTLHIETCPVEVEPGDLDSKKELPPGSWAMLAVGDTGQGMNPDIVSRIFEPFFTTKSIGLGTGLGLATVQRIVNQSRGKVSVSSELGRGTTFSVYLPRIAVASTPGEREESQQTTPPGSETVLVVEDRGAMRRVVVEMLQGLGYNVLQAPDPQEALALARARPGEINLLLTDVVMPRMSGRELAEELTGLCPEIRVLYMSGYAEDEMLRYGVTAGSVELLAKPFTTQELAQRLRLVLDR